MFHKHIIYVGEISLQLLRSTRCKLLYHSILAKLMNKNKTNDCHCGPSRNLLAETSFLIINNFVFHRIKVEKKYYCILLQF